MIIRTISAYSFVISFLICTAQIKELTVLDNKQTADLGIVEKSRYAFSNQDYLLAEELYFKALESSDLLPEDYLYFANTLLANEKPHLAQEFYKEYAKSTSDRDLEYEIATLFDISEPKFEVSHTSELPAYNNAQFYLGNLFIGEQQDVTKYIVDCNGTISPAYTLFKVADNYEIGSVTLFDQENQAIVSAIDLSSNKSSLFYYVKKKGKWSKPKVLFKGIFNDAFPFVDENNKALYFSSIRPGGKGGYDVYISSYNNGSFSEPLNLGQRINTSQNEISPTIIEDWLYFSSNGFISYGGYDIYRYKSLDDYSFVLTNCRDFNSNKDELGAYGLTNETISVRTDLKNMVSVTTYNSISIKSRFIGRLLNTNEQPIEDAIILFPKYGKFIETTADGNFEYRSSQAIEYVDIKIMADGYYSNDSVILAGQVSNFYLIKMEVASEVKKTSNVAVIKGETEPQKSKHIDSSKYYVILGSTYDYEEAYSLWNSWIKSFSEAEIFTYDNGLYRIGVLAGESEDHALTDYRKARDVKTDVWILRPVLD